jgi:hypothetical protein
MSSPSGESSGGWRVLLSLLFLCWAISSCGGSSAPTVRVLFVGNSYTASNGLPEMVQALAASVDREVEVAMTAPGGWWWRDHAASPDTTALISEGDWDFVVLQEQSMAPAVSNLARGGQLSGGPTAFHAGGGQRCGGGAVHDVGSLGGFRRAGLCQL